jgi:hypothetical protein
MNRIVSLLLVFDFELGFPPVIRLTPRSINASNKGSGNRQVQEYFWGNLLRDHRRRRCADAVQHSPWLE